MNRNNNNNKSNHASRPSTVVVNVPSPAAPKRPARSRASPRSRPPKAGAQRAYSAVRKNNKTIKATSSQMRLLSSFTLPRETESVRLSTNYGGDKTAIAKLFRKSNIDGVTMVGGVGDLPRTNVAAFAFRDPLRSFIQSVGVSATDTYTYFNNFSFTAANAKIVYPNFEGPLNLDTTASNISPHGPALYPGRLGISDPYRGFLCSPGDAMFISITGRAGAGGVYQLALCKLVGAQWVEVQSPNVEISQGSGGSAVLGIPEVGYYAWNIFCNSSGLGTSLTVVGGMSVVHAASAANYMVWGQLALPRIGENVEAVRAYRISSVSLMMTNTASPLNRQGQITGLQLPKRTSWIDNIDYEELASSNKAFTLNVVNGLYGFLKPTSSTDFEMDSFQYSTDGDDFEYVFDILPKSDYLTIQASIETDAGRQGIFTPCHHIEFETLSQWFSTDTARGLPTDLDFALRAMSNMAQWHENDFHLSDIWEGIKSAASSVWGGIKEVGSAIAPFAPLALAMI